MSRAGDPSPGPTWTVLLERTPSAMVSSDDDGDDELEIESELMGTPLPKRKAPSSPSLNRANKVPRLRLDQPSVLGNTAPGEGSADKGNRRNDDGPSRTQPASNAACITQLGAANPVPVSMVGSSSSDKFGGTLTQAVRQAVANERLSTQTKGTGPARGNRREPPTRTIARKQVANRPRVSTGSLFQGAQKHGESTARTRIRPKRRTLLINPNALLGDRPLDRARRRSAPAEIIELSDSEPGDNAQNSTFVPKSSKTSAKGPKDPIIISSSSEDRSPLHSPSSRRSSTKKPQSKQKPSHPCPLPRGVDVITISDSDRDVFTSVPIASALRHSPQLALEVTPRPKVQIEKEAPALIPDNSGAEVDDVASHFDPVDTTHEEDMVTGAPATSPPVHISSSVSPVRPGTDNTPRRVHEEHVSPQTAVDAIDRAFGDIDLDLVDGDGCAVEGGIDMDVDTSAPQHCDQSPPPVCSPFLQPNPTAPQNLVVAPVQVPKPLPPPRTFIVPDISSYNVRFKRPESSQLTFFSRAFGQNAVTQATSKITTPEKRVSSSSRDVASVDVPTKELWHKESVSAPPEVSSPGPVPGSTPSLPHPSVSVSGGVPAVKDLPRVSTDAAAMHYELTPPTAISADGSALHSPSDFTYPQQSSIPQPSEQPTRPTSAPSLITATPQQLLNTPSTPILPPRKPPPPLGVSLVDTLNQIRREHLKSRQSMHHAKTGEPVEIDKNVEKPVSPPRREPHPPSPTESQAPPAPSQPQAQEPPISSQAPSLDSLRSLLHEKRHSHPASKAMESEPTGLPGSPLLSIAPSSSRSATDTPPLLARVPTSTAIATPAVSTQTANTPGTNLSTRRPLPVPFEGFISQTPATQRTISSRNPVDSQSRTHRSPRRHTMASFESFIVKVRHGEKEGTEASEDSVVPRAAPAVPRVRQMARKRASQRPKQWYPQGQDISPGEAMAVDSNPHQHPPGVDTEAPDVSVNPEPEQHTSDVEMVGTDEANAFVSSHDIPEKPQNSVLPALNRRDPSKEAMDVRVLDDTLSRGNRLSNGSSRTASSEPISGRSSRFLRKRLSRRRSPSSGRSSVDAVADSIAVRTHSTQQGPSSPSSVTEFIRGYPIITWRSFAAAQRLLPSRYNLAKDLPHSLQDRMNALPVSYRNSDFARTVFEEVILEAMTDEPSAPPIKIYDNGIGEETTPPWEFVYTNEMWLGDGVPPPDVRNLTSCGCQGRCDPKSKTCACSKRQMQWLSPYIRDGVFPATWPGSPFVYDSKGILQREGCPIFECNQFCDCDDDCPNRVVQSGRKWAVNIVRTEQKGWGVFAGAKRIPRGSYIGIYAGELLTEQEGEDRGHLYNVFGRTYLFTIDFHHLRIGLEDEDSFENMYVVDAYHAGNFTRFLNHSCDPNCEIVACYINDADVNKPLLAVFTIRDVDPWEELCFSYYGDMETKREELAEQKAKGAPISRQDAVYVRCACGSANCIGKLF